jgi:hypothetical protein
MCLPYIKHRYPDILFNIKYYSHNYGSYPNFDVIGDLIKLNYVPTENPDNTQYTDLLDISKLSFHLNGKNTEHDTREFYSYKDDFKTAHNIFFEYFKFDNDITNEVDLFTRQHRFNEKKVLGVHYRGTDKSVSPFATYISDADYIKVIKYHLEKNPEIDTIFISTDENLFVDYFKENLVGYHILIYNVTEGDTKLNPTDGLHINRLKIVENVIRGYKKNINTEEDIKRETNINREQLKEIIINCLILSKCDQVIKMQSQLSAYAKVFNPDLKIWRVSALKHCYWPDCNIELYPCDIDDVNVKNILISAQTGEFNEHKKNDYISLSKFIE